jgi:YD repeat-containing protein
MEESRKKSGNCHVLKWLTTAILLITVAFLFRWKPALHPPKFEFLPVPGAGPGWNGSHPFLTLSGDDYLTIATSDAGSQQPKFSSSISLIQPTLQHDGPVDQFQVDLHSGRFILRQTDLFAYDIPPLVLTRTYITWDPHSRAFGQGGNHPYDICPTGTRFPYTYMDLNLEDGQQVHFRRVSKGTGFADAAFRHLDTSSSEFFLAQIAWNGDGWTLDRVTGNSYKFPEAYHSKNCAQGAPWEIHGPQGQLIQLKRDSERNLQQLISPSGHTMTFKYDPADRIVEANDDAGNLRKYEYDETGHLRSVSDAKRTLYRFEYTDVIHEQGYDPYVMTKLLDGKGHVLLQNSYAQGGRVTKQQLANGEVFQYHYYFVNSNIVQTIVTTKNGTRRFFFKDGILYRDW